MSYDYRSRKVVLVIADKLPAGQAMNVAGHLAIALGHRLPADAMGRQALVDASGVAHAGISRYPVIVKRASAGQLRRVVGEARGAADVLVADFPRPMLETGHDDELAAALAAAAEADLEYLGVGLFGPTEAIDGLSRRYSLWS